MKRLGFGVLAIAFLIGPAMGSGLAVPESSESVVVEGTVQVLVACDLDGGTAAYTYNLTSDDGEELTLDLTPETAPGIRSGDRIQVRGTRQHGLFVVQETQPVLMKRALAGRQAASTWTTGTRRVLAILIKFPEDTTTPYTQAAAQGVLFSNTSSVKNLYTEASYGATTLAGDVTPWLTATVAKPTTCDTSVSASQAVSRATAAGYNTANYDLLVYAQTSLPGCGWSGLAYVGGSGAWINGNSFSTLVVGHELGHNFGLLHAHSLACSGRIYGPTCDTTGSRSEYGDRFDTMGNSRSGHFSSYAKSSLDWMPTGSVVTHASGAADYDLSPLEITTGVRAIEIPTSVSNRTFWIEFRQPLGFDASFPAGGTNGAQIRIGPSRVGGTDLLDSAPSTGTFDDAALVVGQTFVDPASNLLARVVSKTGSGASSSLRVHVQYGGAQEAIRGDLNGDGWQDILWRNSTTGQDAAWQLIGTSLLSIVDLPALPDTAYVAAGAGDFNADGRPDIVWRNVVTGQNAVWLMNGASLASIVDLPALPNVSYVIGGIGDFDGDGNPDIVWRNVTTGQNAIWLMNGTSLKSIVDLPALPNLNYIISGVADLNGDNKPDIVWRNAGTGQNAVWLMNGTSLGSIVDLPALPNTNYRVGALADYDGDGNIDIVWRNTASGQDAVWLMNGTSLKGIVDLPALSNTSYEMAGPK